MSKERTSITSGHLLLKTVEHNIRLKAVNLKSQSTIAFLFNIDGITKSYMIEMQKSL